MRVNWNDRSFNDPILTLGKCSTVSSPSRLKLAVPVAFSTGPVMRMVSSERTLPGAKFATMRPVAAWPGDFSRLTMGTLSVAGVKSTAASTRTRLPLRPVISAVIGTAPRK